MIIILILIIYSPLTQAFVVGTIVICIPSMIYNVLFKTVKKEIA